jgi:hypothetical protein
MPRSRLERRSRRASRQRRLDGWTGSEGAEHLGGDRRECEFRCDMGGDRVPECARGGRQFLQVAGAVVLGAQDQRLAAAVSVIASPLALSWLRIAVRMKSVRFGVEPLPYQQVDLTQRERARSHRGWSIRPRCDYSTFAVTASGGRPADHRSRHGRAQRGPTALLLDEPDLRAAGFVFSPHLRGLRAHRDRPQVDLEKDVVAHVRLEPVIRCEPKPMDTRIITAAPMGPRNDLLTLAPEQEGDVVYLIRWRSSARPAPEPRTCPPS